MSANRQDVIRFHVEARYARNKASTERPCMAKKFVPYFEKLKDPRWQRKRLEIMNRASFKCEECGDSDQTLHVHHGYYDKDLQPWEYSNDTLWCLCEGCHQNAQDRLCDLHKRIAQLHPTNIPSPMLVDLHECCDLSEMYDDLRPQHAK